MTNYFFGVDQKIPAWLMNIIFLGEVEAAVRSGVKSRDWGQIGAGRSVNHIHRS